MPQKFCTNFYKYCIKHLETQTISSEKNQKKHLDVEQYHYGITMFGAVNGLQ